MSLQACGGSSDGGVPDITPPALKSNTKVVTVSTVSVISLEFNEKVKLVSSEQTRIEAGISNTTITKTETDTSGVFVYTLTALDKTITDKMKVSFNGSEINVINFTFDGTPKENGVVSLSSSTLAGKSGDLKISFLGLLQDEAGNVMGSSSTPVEYTVKITNGNTVGLSITDDEAPVLAHTDDKDIIQSLSVDREAKTFTISFNESVKDVDKTKFTIEKLTVARAFVDSEDSKKVVIEVDETISDGTYKVVMENGAVSDLSGNVLAATQTEEITIPNTNTKADDDKPSLENMSDAYSYMSPLGVVIDQGYDF